MACAGRGSGAVAAILVLGALSSCFSGTQTTGAREPLRPQPSVRFPARVTTGSVHTVVVTIRNPAKDRIGPIEVIFSRVGRVSGSPVVPQSIVDPGFKRRTRAVVAVRPRPVAVSQDGLVYRFGDLPSQATMTVRFDLRMPRRPGIAANAVIASDGGDLRRARGVPLRTTVVQGR